MALVKYGGGITQMTGSFAGNTFARNRSGNYMRARTKPVNPKSAAQDIVRSSIMYLVEYWAETLTADQRDAWATYALNTPMKNKLGETIKLTGFNQFIRSNAIRAAHNVIIIANAPALGGLPEGDPSFKIDATASDDMISITMSSVLPWSIEDGAICLAFAGRPQSKTRNFFAGPWGYLTGIGGSTPGPLSWPHLTKSPFTLSLGQHLWVYARIQRADGRLSDPFRDDCFVTA